MPATRDGGDGGGGGMPWVQPPHTSPRPHPTSSPSPSVSPPPQYQPPQYQPQPLYRPSYQSPSQPAPSGWRSGIASGVLSEISAILELFQFSTGYVWNAQQVDTWEQHLAITGFYTQADKAFAFLFGQLSSDQQKAMPWAEFGLGETDYLDKAGKAKSYWYDLTGQDMPHGVLNQYMANNWNQSQLQQFAQKDSTLSQTLPWLAAGQSYLQTSEAYVNAYGHAPADASTLSGWFKFRQSAQQIGSGRPAIQQPTQQAQVRQKDIEIR